MTTSAAPCASARVPDRVLLALACIAVGIGCLWFWPTWISTPELSHAFAAPIFCAWLWHASRLEPSWASTPWRRSLAQLLLGLGGLSMATLAMFSVLAQGLMQAQSLALGAYALVALLGTILLALDAGAQPLARFNGAGLAGCLIWVLAVPLPPGPLVTLTQTLRDHTTAVVLSALHWLGYSAVRHGNIIEFPHCVVGVEDACSGLRSLLACTFVGLVLAGLLVRGFWWRVLLVAGSAALAVVGNYIRSLVLCLLINAGVDIAGFWHDATAYALLGITAVTMYAGAAFVGRQQRPAAPAEGGSRVRHRLWLPACLALFMGVATVFAVWKTRVRADEVRAVPDFAQLLHVATPGWTAEEDREISDFAATLGTEHLYAINYRRPGTEVSVYMAFWEPGQSTLGLVSFHQPAYCMPGTGWIAQPTPAALPRYPLGTPQRFTYSLAGEVQQVWYWHFYGGRLIGQLPGFLPWQVAPSLLREPVSARAPQWVIRIASNRPLEELQSEPLLQEIFRRIESAGLAERVQP